MALTTAGEPWLADQVAGSDSSEGANRVAQHSALLAVSAGLVGVLSYTCSLLVAHLLAPADYSQYAAGVMLLGIVGIVANALVPLPLANLVRRFGPRSDGRRDAMSFAVLVSLIVGAGAAVVTGGITAAFAPASVAIAVGLSALVLFAVAPPLGWLQGELRFGRYAMVSTVEVAVRLAFSMIAIAIGWGTPGALLGFVVGALVLLSGPFALARDVAWRPGVLRERARWSETGDIALTQLVVSALVGADVVLLALVGEGSVVDAGYQAVSTLAKAPVYVAAGTVLVVFPLLRSVGARVHEILSAALRSFARLALLAAVVLATVPAELALLVLPVRYSDSLGLLPWLAAAGLGYAAVTVLTTVLLALRAYRRCQLALLAATILMVAGFAAGWNLDGIRGLAIGSAIGALAATVVLTGMTAPYLPKGIARFTIVALGAFGAVLFILFLASPHPAVWLAIAGVACGWTLTSGRHGATRAVSISLPRITRLQLINAAPAAALGLLALVVRGTGLARANDLFIDEVTYSQFAAQIAQGGFPTEEGDDPFFLHPPGSMMLNGLVVRLMGIPGSAMDLVYELRWVNAVLGSLIVALAFLIVRRVVNTPVAAVAALVLALDPFVLRNDSRVMIETPATILLLAGWLVLLTRLAHPPGRSATWRELVAGLLVGTAFITKDMTVVPGVVGVVLAVVWRQTLSIRTATRVVVAATVPYGLYLIELSSSGLISEWADEKLSGILRMVGIQQTTGFNAVIGVSLYDRLVDEVPRFGTSYVLLALCIPAGLVAAFSQHRCRRFLGIVAVSTGALGTYAVAGGAAEEQFGYYVLVASVLALSAVAGDIVEHRHVLRRWGAMAAAVFVALTAMLGAPARFVTDDGYAQARTWLNANVRDPAAVGVTGVTAEFAFPEFDVSPSLVALQDNGDSYVLTASQPIEQGYGYAAPALLDWLEQHARPVFDAPGPTNGHVTVWQLDRSVLEAEVNAGALIRPVSG